MVLDCFREAAENDALLLELGLPDGKHLIEHLILNVGSGAQLFDGNLEPLVHVSLLLLDYLEVLFELLSSLYGLLLLVLKHDERSVSISETHLVLIEVKQ